MSDDIYKQEYLNHSRPSSRKKMALQDISGHGNDMVFEINWNKFVAKKAYFKITVGDKTSVVSSEQLYAILFMFGSAAQQEKLVSPFFKKTRVSKYFKLIGITAQKDVHKGEMLNVPLEFTLNPETNQVIIGKGNMKAIRRAALAPS